MTSTHDFFTDQRPSWPSQLLSLESPSPDMAEQSTIAEATPDEQLQRFENFFHDFEQPIFGYLWRMTSDEQVASDLLQETFVRAWQHFTQISHYDRPGSWLFRVATNLALNYRRNQKIPFAHTVPVQETDRISQRDIGSLLALRDMVREALLALSPRQRSALVLREIYGLSLKEISHVLHLAPNTVKVTLWRAREQFRAHYLQANSVEEPAASPSAALEMVMDDLAAGDDGPELFFSQEEEQL